MLSSRSSLNFSAYIILLQTILLTQAYSQTDNSLTREEKETNINPGNTTEEQVNVLDKSQVYVTSEIRTLANNLDSFFGAQRADDELNRSSLRLSYDYLMTNDEAPVGQEQIRVNLKFPRLEKFLKFNFDSDERRKRKEAQKKAQASQPTNESSPKEEKEPWRFRMDSGLNASIPPRVFARGRLRKNWVISEKMINRLQMQMSWFSDRGWIQAIEVLNDYSLTDKLLFRFQNTKTWEISQQEVNTSHGPSLVYRASDDDGLSLNFRARTRYEEIWFLASYNVNITYRRNLYKNWLFGELSPGINYAREDYFRDSQYLLVRLETLFGTESRAN
jgi:hypothetical protein